MKQIGLTGLAALAGVLAIAAPATAQGAPKIGYINSQQILAQAPGTTEAQQAFETDMTRYRAQVDSLEAALETAQQDFQRQQSTLSESARRERQQELQQQFTEYQQRLGELEQLAQRRQQELVQPIMQRISGVIEQIREEQGFAMIFDAASGGVITADPSLDLTEQVLERLRAGAQAGQ